MLGHPHGLHAGPAARLVGEITRHGLRAELRNRTKESRWVPAESLGAVMTLDGQCGDEIELRVWEPGAGRGYRGRHRCAGRGLALVDPVRATGTAGRARVRARCRSAILNPL